MAHKFEENNEHFISTTPSAATHQTPASGRHILHLPNEILQEIASLLPTDHDVFQFSQTCKAMWTKVFAPESAVWRALFTKYYDVPPGMSSTQLRNEYQIRAIVLGANFNFANKEDDRLYLCMQVLQTMLEEATTLHLKPGCQSKTLKRLYESLMDMNLLRHSQKDGRSELFFALQLCLAPIAFDSTVTQACRRNEYELAIVYSFGEDLGVPYIDVNQNLDKVLQMMSFWQRHLLTASELTYNEVFASLPAHLKPGIQKLDQDDVRKLSTSWLGLYSCLHPLPTSMEAFAQLSRQTCGDLEDHVAMNEVMTLELKAQPNGEIFWPLECSRIAPPVGPDSRRLYFDGKQNVHGSTGEVDNPVFGFLEEIGVSYGGFSGWSRICFVILQGEASVDSTDLGSGMEAAEWVHCYEALIIPSGRMMLGRWVDLKDQSGRGPFIFWDV